MPHRVRIAARHSRVLLSPWVRFAVLVALLAAAGAAVLAWHPQRLMTAHGWQPHASGGTAVLLFAVAYGLCTVAFVPRPLLNAAAGALYGIHAGLPAAIGGTVLGAGLAFLLGRLLGRDAVRPLLRGRVALSLDRQLSRHGFRSTLALRLFPGVPFAAANYAAAVSRIRLLPFLTATAAGSAANTAAYVVAGSRAASPTSPVFLLALGFLGVTGVAAAVVARGARTRSRTAARTDPGAAADRTEARATAVSGAGPGATASGDTEPPATAAGHRSLAATATGDTDRGTTVAGKTDPTATAVSDAAPPATAAPRSA